MLLASQANMGILKGCSGGMLVSLWREHNCTLYDRGPGITGGRGGSRAVEARERPLHSWVGYYTAIEVSATSAAVLGSQAGAWLHRWRHSLLPAIERGSYSDSKMRRGVGERMG